MSKPVSTHSAKPFQVVLVQQVFKQYRQPLFDAMIAALALRGIQLTICFSAPSAYEASKADNIVAPPSSHYQQVRLAQYGPLVWQDIPHQADLWIIEQANRHLLNWFLLLRRRLLKHRTAPVLFWGHGFHHQRQRWLLDSIKRCTLGFCDGFFAYTEQVANYVIAQGVAPERVRVVPNSQETATLSQRVAALKHNAVNAKDVKPATPVLLFCGALYADKKLELLLQTAAVLAEKQQLSKLIVVGDGPLKPWLIKNSTPWLDYRGSCFAEDKAQAFAEADMVLNPGLIGLAVLDAFACGLPVISTDFAGHSPEFSYLRSGVNGLVLAQEPSQLAQAIWSLWQDQPRLSAMQQAALTTAAQFNLEAMVDAFVDGIVYFQAALCKG